MTGVQTCALPICGHLKDDWFNEQLHISPSDPGCEEQFWYALDGQVLPATPAATEMVRVLGLDRGFLTSRRREALAGVFDDDFLLSATRAELGRLAIEFRTPGPDGELSAFFHVIARYAERLLAP